MKKIENKLTNVSSVTFHHCTISGFNRVLVLLKENDSKLAGPYASYNHVLAVKIDLCVKDASVHACIMDNSGLMLLSMTGASFLNSFHATKDQGRQCPLAINAFTKRL